MAPLGCSPIRGCEGPGEEPAEVKKSRVKRERKRGRINQNAVGGGSASPGLPSGLGSTTHQWGSLLRVGVSSSRSYTCPCPRRSRGEGFPRRCLQTMCFSPLYFTPVLAHVFSLELLSYGHLNNFTSVFSFLFIFPAFSWAAFSQPDSYFHFPLWRVAHAHFKEDSDAEVQ